MQRRKYIKIIYGGKWWVGEVQNVRFAFEEVTCALNSIE